MVKKNPLGLLEIESSIYKRFFEAGAMGVVIAGDPKPGSEIHDPMWKNAHRGWNAIIFRGQMGRKRRG